MTFDSVTFDSAAFDSAAATATSAPVHVLVQGPVSTITVSPDAAEVPVGASQPAPGCGCRAASAP